MGAALSEPLALARSLRAAKAQRAKRAALLKHVFLIAASLVMIYPLLWMLSSSFKPNNQIFGDPSLWPREVTWANYPEGWNGMAVSFGVFFQGTGMDTGVAPMDCLPRTTSAPGGSVTTRIMNGSRSSSAIT